MWRLSGTDMDLKDAVVQAAGFAGSEGFLAFAPAEHGFEHALLMVVSEGSEAFWRLGTDVIQAPMLTPTKVTQEAVRAVGVPARFGAPNANGYVTVSGPLARYEIPAKLPERQLTRPEFGTIEWRTLEPWSAVSRILHAVGKDEDRPALRYVCLGPDGFSATDEVAVARATLDLGFEDRVLISVEAFRKWPKGPVEFGVAPGVVVFKIGEELRVIEAFTGWFPETDGYIPPKAECKAVFQLPRKPLVALVNSAARATQRHVIAVGQTGESFVVQGGDFRGQLDYKEINGDWRLMLDGKRLWHSLRAAQTDNVELGYHGQDQPLTIWGDDFQEAIYPMAKMDVT